MFDMMKSRRSANQRRALDQSETSTRGESMKLRKEGIPSQNDTEDLDQDLSRSCSSLEASVLV